MLRPPASNTAAATLSRGEPLTAAHVHDRHPPTEPATCDPAPNTQMVAVPITRDEPESAQNQTICTRLSSPTGIAFTSSYSFWLLTLWIGGDGVVCPSWGTWLAWHPAGHDRRQDRGCLARAVSRESVSFAVSHRITSAASEVTSSPTHPRGCAVGGGRAGRSRPPSVMSGAMHTLGNRCYARLGGGDKTWPLTTAVSRLPAVRVL